MDKNYDRLLYLYEINFQIKDDEKETTSKDLLHFNRAFKGIVPAETNS